MQNKHHVQATVIHFYLSLFVNK